MPKKKDLDLDAAAVVDVPVMTDMPIVPDMPIVTDVPVVADEPQVVQILPGCRAVSLWESRRPA